MQRARSALICFSAVAASILVASATAAAGPNAIVLDDHEIEATASSMTLAALDPMIVETENERAIDRLVPNPNGRIFLSAEDAVVGIASFYDDPQETASGEQYDPNAFTAAAQLDIRHKFGGVQFGRLYQAAYGLGEYGGKKIIVRFNDVGPLRPGRKFDLSRAAMTYFDSSLDKGLLPNFKMTPLPLGRAYPLGPVTDEQLAGLGIDDDAAANVCDDVMEEPKPTYTASIAQLKPAAVQITRPDKSKSRSAARVSAKTQTAKTQIAKTRPTRVAATTPAIKPAVAKAAVSRTAARTPAAASKAADQSQPMTPWIRRVVNWVASAAAGDQAAQRAGASDKRRVAAQAR